MALKTKKIEAGHYEWEHKEHGVFTIKKKWSTEEWVVDYRTPDGEVGYFNHKSFGKTSFKIFPTKYCATHFIEKWVQDPTIL